MGFPKIGVIGGGAAGMTAAIFAAQAGAEVFLTEKNEKPGKKLYITGKGRCNITNDCDTDEFFAATVRGSKFLRSALAGFTPADTMAFFERSGLPLTVERGRRVFPASGKSSDVIKTLKRELEKQGVDVRLNFEVSEISKTAHSFIVKSKSGETLSCDKLIIATGGLSYPSTGSTGDGYRFAEKFGLSVVAPVPALTPLILTEDVSPLEGISLKNIALTARDKSGKAVGSEFGEALFTKRGLSGPVALTISSFINRLTGISLFLDLKPALDRETLERRILRDFGERHNQELKSATRALLPDRLNSYVIERAGISPRKCVNSVTKEERGRLIDCLKGLKFAVAELGGFDQAVVTSGGVDLKCLKPTMECRDIPGLYFAGEVIDADSLTGGYNLQIAFSTAVKAARDAVN